MIRDMRKLNISELREHLESLSKMVSNSASKDDLLKLENFMKQIHSQVESNSSEISRLVELLNNLKSLGSGSGGNSGASNNDIMLLRSRMEYLENQVNALKKQFTDLKKQVDDLIEGLKGMNSGDNSALEKALRDLEG